MPRSHAWERHFDRFLLLCFQADTTAATSRCHCGYKQIPLRLQIDTPATTNRCHCGYKQIPLRRQADATAATNRSHCGYKQMPLRLHTVNKTADRPNIRQHSCPTSSHTLYSRSSSHRRMIRSVRSFRLTDDARAPSQFLPLLPGSPPLLLSLIHI